MPSSGETYSSMRRGTWHASTMPPSALIAVALVATLVSPVSACTNLLVSAGATADGSTLLAYNADSGSLYGSLGVYPAAEHAPNATREVWDWDSSVYLGALPEASSTLAVSGNANAAGLVIGETTFGGIEQLDGGGHGHVVDYGSLIWITLQRAEGAMEAIELMDNLTATHGYASSGESFSIVDPGGDAWLLELIGKGKERGTVWVATKVPDTAVLAHANQARTTTFLGQSADGALPCATLPQARAMSEAKRAGLVCLYAADVVDFEVAQGLYHDSEQQEGSTAVLMAERALGDAQGRHAIARTPRARIGPVSYTHLTLPTKA